MVSTEPCNLKTSFVIGERISDGLSKYVRLSSFKYIRIDNINK